MDCPSEEQLIRGALSGVGDIVRLEFDLPSRSVTAWHDGDVGDILSQLEGLGLGASLSGTEDAAPHQAPDEAQDQTRALRLALAINAVMFAVELTAGWLAGSAGLLADSLDMFADAAVYGVSLWAVGGRAEHQRTAARMSGWIQLVLALGVLGEVVRRALQGGAPEPPLMLGVAAIALVANVLCLWVLSRHRRAGAHMQASWIFTSNDVIANAGVIVAGGLVAWTSSGIPDLVVGAIIGAIVLRGALRILAIARR